MNRSIFRAFFFISLFSFTQLQAQQDSSCHLRISVLTCSPGDELYSLFGHSALRIYDSSNFSDITYNWGTFDFDEPDFYLKFAQGRLLYFVSTSSLPDFLYEYTEEGRSVTEQVLNLTCEEKIKIKKAVDLNMQGNNRFYKYDFILDNCTTRIRDLVEKNTNGFHVTSPTVAAGTTFRNMLYYYLDRGSQPWSKLGIDILLGAVVDKPVTTDQSMFLPEYLMKGLDTANGENGPVVGTKKLILPAQQRDEYSGVYTPLITIGTICIILFVISILNFAWAKIFTKFADSLLIYITGILGLLLIFMWFFTDHTACADNYNLLWALPTNTIAGFWVWKRTAIAKKYFKTITLLTVLLLITWFWLPQHLNIAVLPFAIYMLSRYVKLSKN